MPEPRRPASLQFRPQDVWSRVAVTLAGNILSTPPLSFTGSRMSSHWSWLNFEELALVGFGRQLAAKAEVRTSKCRYTVFLAALTKA